MPPASMAARRVAPTKADTVYEELRAQLIGGRRRYGETLSSAELALEFGVSRRPVMDALLRLEMAGFIEIVRQVGCRVVVPDEASVREHFQTAAVLEGAAARLAAAVRGGDQRAELERALRASGAAAAANDVPAFEAANKDLHATLQVAAGNQRLAHLAHGAWDLSDFYLQRRTRDDLHRSHAEHEAIVAAVLAGDAAAARDRMEAHMERFAAHADG